MPDGPLASVAYNEFALPVLRLIVRLSSIYVFCFDEKPILKVDFPTLICFDIFPTPWYNNYKQQ